MPDIRDDLSHVLWLGGAPRAGKTTLARLLAGKYDLRIYNLDWHYWREHQSRGGSAMRWIRERTADELWLGPSELSPARRSLDGWTEAFPLVVEDLLALPRTRPIVAEGPGALPWCVASVIQSASQAIFLVPAPDRRDLMLERRERASGQRFGESTSDVVRARDALREHDRAVGERIEGSSRELGLRCIRLGPEVDLVASLELVEQRFRPHLPEALNV